MIVTGLHICKRATLTLHCANIEYYFETSAFSIHVRFLLWQYFSVLLCFEEKKVILTLL